MTRKYKGWLSRFSRPVVVASYIAATGLLLSFAIASIDDPALAVCFALFVVGTIGAIAAVLRGGE